MKSEIILTIKEEVEKQLEASFRTAITYSDWVANIVPVPKKDRKVRMCIDYRDLNWFSPKDNFSLPHIDTLVDNSTTIGSSPSWKDFQAITRSKRSRRINPRQHSPLIG